MSKSAWAYILGVLVSGTLLSALAAATAAPLTNDLTALVVMACFATVSQLFEAEHGRQSFYPHFVFFIAALLTLQPLFFIIVVAIPHLVEWAKERITDGAHLRAWYIQPFNIAVHIIAGYAAWGVYNRLQTDSFGSATPAPLVSATGAVITYVMINHILVGMVLVLARGISWKESGVLEFECLLPDLILSYLGYVVAVLWQLNPWYILPAILPLALMYRALMVPQLKQEAQTDSKTGLWNARYFTKLFTTEMERARRLNRPLTVLMADLDLLRNINNTYGHLAGDDVLAGIGDIIKQNIREYDIPGRFGGEEFAIVLPETGPVDANVLAERLRAAVEAATFVVSTSATPISCTMSIGVACMPWDAVTLPGLIHGADLAVYQAKLKGRNCVTLASEVPNSVRLERAANDERVSSPYDGTFLPRSLPQDVINHMAHGQEDLHSQYPVAAGRTSSGEASS